MLHCYHFKRARIFQLAKIGVITMIRPVIPFQYRASMLAFTADHFMNCRIVFRYDFALTRLDNYDLFCLASVRRKHHVAIKVALIYSDFATSYCSRDRSLMFDLGSRHPRTEACRTNEETIAKPEARKRRFVHCERSIGC